MPNSQSDRLKKTIDCIRTWALNDSDTVCVDDADFCQTFLSAWKKHLISSGVKQRNKPSRLSVGEVMTIVIAFHQSGYRNFKTYYIHFVCRYLTNEFPKLVSYTQMFKFMQCILVFFVLTSLTVRDCLC